MRCRCLFRRQQASYTYQKETLLIIYVSQFVLQSIVTLAWTIRARSAVGLRWNIRSEDCFLSGWKWSCESKLCNVTIKIAHVSARVGFSTSGSLTKWSHGGESFLVYLFFVTGSCSVVVSVKNRCVISCFRDWQVHTFFSIRQLRAFAARINGNNVPRLVGSIQRIVDST